MKIKTLAPFLWLPLAASLVAATAVSAQSPSTPAKSAPPPAAGAPSANADQKLASASPSAAAPDRAQSYYHSALAHIYEEEAIASGRPEYMRHAVEEYKTALSADPNSPELNDELADLYFRTGQVREAEATARGLLKSSPNDIDAHRLLGRLYLRQLSEAQNSVSSSSPTGNTLDQAIAEFQKIVALDPKSVEDRMVLGQLYTVKHQNEKAEEQFKAAQDHRSRFGRSGPQSLPPLCRERRSCPRCKSHRVCPSVRAHAQDGVRARGGLRPVEATQGRD